MEAQAVIQSELLSKKQRKELALPPEAVTIDPTAFIRCVNGMMDYFITARMISLMHSFEYWSPATVGCSWTI